MRVVICAGEKTDHICNYLKAKSSLSIEPIQSVLDVISRIESGGFIADKVVIFGFALDNVGEDKDLDDVFDSLTQIASEAIDNKELLIVNRGTKGRDYDRSRLQGCHKEKPPKMDGFNYFRYSPRPEGGSLGYSSSSKLSNGPLRPERWSLVYSTFSSTSLSISFLACAEGRAA